MKICVYCSSSSKIEKKYIKRSSLRSINSPYGHCVANPGNDKDFENNLDKNINELLS